MGSALRRARCSCVRPLAQAQAGRHRAPRRCTGWRPPAPANEDTPRHTEPVRPAPAPPSAPAPAPPVQEPEDAAPAQRYDREMTSSLALKFKVEPDDAVVTVKAEDDRRFTVIGRAGEYAADKKKLPAYDLPGAGVYYVRIAAVNSCGAGPVSNEVSFSIEAGLPGVPQNLLADVTPGAVRLDRRRRGSGKEH